MKSLKVRSIQGCEEGKLILQKVFDWQGRCKVGCGASFKFLSDHMHVPIPGGDMILLHRQTNVFNGAAHHCSHFSSFEAHSASTFAPATAMVSHKVPTIATNVCLCRAVRHKYLAHTFSNGTGMWFSIQAVFFSFAPVSWFVDFLPFLDHDLGHFCFLMFCPSLQLEKYDSHKSTRRSSHGHFFPCVGSWRFWRTDKTHIGMRKEDGWDGRDERET